MSGAENNFDKLFGRNGELVEERKKQVLAGALEIVQRYYKETLNKMEVIAALFGKKLGEEFKIKYGDGLAFEATVKFTKKNFRVKHLPLQDYWSWDNELLAALLKGKAVIVDE